MQIIEISEVGTAGVGEHTKHLAVGIDFGTTNSLIAFSKRQVPMVVLDNKSRELIPSTIGFQKGEFIIGETTDKEVGLLHSIKRLFGKKLSDLQANPALLALVQEYIDVESEILRIRFADQAMTVPELAAQIFLYLKKQAISTLNSEITKAVITVPAHFNDAARGEVMLAAKIAGFEVLRLIAEPTAAAYAYGLNTKAQGCYLVYDLGGGTFDVSILNMQTGILQVIATGGDNILGGDDIDHLVMHYFCDKYQLGKCKELIILAKSAKETLSFQNKFTGVFRDNVVELKREDFENLILPLVKRTLDITQDTLTQAGRPNISGIILVGGSTRIPLISQTLKQKFNTVIFSDINPDKAVVWGAALQAENLTNVNAHSLLIDVVPLSLGIELNGGITDKLILRNTPIPISITKEFTTSVDNQRFMKLHIVQGEREMAADCRSLARYELELPLMKAGGVRTEITFSIDADGILSITALEKNSSVSHAISVKPSYGLSEDEITKILENAYQNAAEDHHKRLLQETIMDAQSLIYNVESAIKEIGTLLKEDKIAKMHQAILIFKESLKSTDRDYIIKCSRNFESTTQSIISTRLNNVVAELLKGRHIE
ncbi:Fe-S protein assembly chaperone HscA [Candidatus Tisiphia endosymbiont of Nemotelus uliginosus]|uniref:Fe-S protein assembly chaperone HscA n=1 Tax=Candidatus Tisiphia endosymbiont of Nemotelus uliginosus TaxID=3077926 RepID=UPI0035C902C8